MPRAAAHPREQDSTPALDALGRAVALSQGVFWTATGVWSLLHYRSFEAVTGPKRDEWLVKTMGGLIACVGATLLASARAGRARPETALLGASAAAALSAADLVYVSRGRISRVYLLDVLAEAPFFACWAAWAWLRRRAAAGRARPDQRWRTAIASFDPRSRSASSIAAMPKVSRGDGASDAPIGWIDDTTSPAAP